MADRYGASRKLVWRVAHGPKRQRRTDEIESVVGRDDIWITFRAGYSRYFW